MEFKTYTRRTGSGDLGRDYEIKVTALLALRCAFLADTENLWLGANADQVGDYDDVVLCRKTTDGKHVAYLVQLKHQENPKQLTRDELLVSNQKNNFLLSKYHTSYLALTKKLASQDRSSDIINFLKKCNEIYLVLYTNKLASQSEILELSLTENLKFLNTGCSSSIFKFKSSIDLSLDADFFKHLVLFANQAHVNSVDELIDAEIRPFVKDDSKIVAQDFLAYITTWYKLPDAGFTLTKLDVINKLVQLSLDPHVVQFSRESFPDCGHPQENTKNTWHDISSASSILSIDCDDLTLKFLKLYLASEVKKYVQIGNRKKWGDHLPKQVQTNFLDTFLNPNIKVMTREAQMTVFDVYQHLWLCKKLPLLVRVQDENDYVNVLHVLKATGANLNVFVLKSSLWDVQGVASSLHNLENEQQIAILSLEVKLQGRPAVKLQELLEPDMFKHVKFKDIIYALGSLLNVGGMREDLPDQFIEQKLSKIYLKHEVMSKLADDLFLTENYAEASAADLPNVLSFGQNADMEAFKLQNKDVHKVNYYNGFYIGWTKTLGSIKSIREYQANHIYEQLNQDLKDFNILVPTKPWSSLKDHQEEYRQVQIISANPGMGKSVLMNLIASETPTSTWVLKVNLSEYEDYYFELHELPILEQLKVLNRKVLEKTNCHNLDLGQAVFNKFLTKRKVLILLDGFDEIAVLFKNEITKMAEGFYKDGWPIWITTRPVMKTHLEDTFNTFAFTLRPFTLTDQQSYLAKYFPLILDPGTKLSLMMDFINELLDSSKNNFQDLNFQFTGVPLQTKFLADVFAKEYRECIRTSKIDFNRSFDLLYLYEEFSKNKTEILCSKYGKDAKRTRILFKKYQQLYAVMTAIPPGYLKDFDLKTTLEKYAENKDDEMHFLQREGVLALNQYVDRSKYKFNVKFVHLTYAEFLASQWFVENIDNEELNKTIKAIYQWRFTNYSNQFFFKITDLILAKGCPTHLAIINYRLDQIVVSEETRLDKAERTSLHLLALYGVTHSTALQQTSSKIEDDLVDYVNLMLHDLSVKDKILSYNPFEYSLKNMTLAIANRICEKQFPECSLEVLGFHNFIYLNYSSIHNYLPLYKTLLLHYGGRSILLEFQKQDLTIEEINSKHNNFKDSMRLVNEIGVNKVLDLYKFQEKNNHFYSKLNFAVSFGDVANVEYLLNQDLDLDVNEKDCDGNTLLYYATVFKKFHTLQLLLKRGAEVNTPCSQGNTALHIATKKGHKKFVLELLKNAADVNQLNDQNQTPICLAVLKKHLDVVELLEENGAVLNIEDLDGNSLLHYASQTGSTEFILNYLSHYPLSVNKQNKKGETSLLLAAKNRKLEAVRLLFLSGASANKEAEDGYTPLHFAAQEGFYQIAVEILCNNGDINTIDKLGQTALLLSLKLNQKEISELLVENGANCNIGDNDRYVPIHLAIQAGWTELSIMMMAKGALIDTVDRCNSTPLHAAIQSCNLMVTNILLACDIDFNVRDNLGNAPLHYAATFGQTDMVQELLSCGAKIDVLNKLNHTPLQSAMFTGKIDTAELLLAQGANWNIVDVIASTFLHLASRFGQTGLMLCFLSSGGDPDAKNVDGDTPLHIAAKHGMLTAVEILLAHRALVNEKNCKGQTPLHLIVENRVYGMFEKWKYPDCLKIVRFLLENKADVNIRDNYGDTVLHYVCVLKNKPFPLSEEAINDIMENFYLPVALLLLENKIDTKIKNIEEKTALDLAIRANYASLISMLKNV